MTGPFFAKLVPSSCCKCGVNLDDEGAIMEMPGGLVSICRRCLVRAVLSLRPGPSVTAGVPYIASVTTGAAGDIAARVVCSHCGDEHTLELDADELDAIGAVALVEQQRARFAVHAATAGVRGLLERTVPRVVASALWWLTHTTGHHAALMREAAAVPLDVVEEYPPGTVVPPISDDETGRAKDVDGTITIYRSPARVA